MTPPTWRQRFLARFDTEFLSAPAQATAKAGAAPANGVQTAMAELLAVDGLFASAHFRLSEDSALTTGQCQALEWQMLALDGTHHMHRLGGPWAQRWHRLTLKVTEAWGGAPLGPGTPSGQRPWDCGFVRAGPQAVALASRFCPRRPSLLVVWQWPIADSRALEDALRAQSSNHRHVVRLLVCGAAQ